MASSMLKVVFGIAIGTTAGIGLLSSITGSPHPEAAAATEAVASPEMVSNAFTEFPIDKIRREKRERGEAVVNEFPIDKKAREKSERAEAKTSKHSQRNVDEAEGTVGFIIGLNGYHCIKVIDVQRTESPSLYGVECITDHDGHRANYMVNAQTNDVSEI